MRVGVRAEVRGGRKRKEEEGGGGREWREKGDRVW